MNGVWKWCALIVELIRDNMNGHAQATKKNTVSLNVIYF